MSEFFGAVVSIIGWALAAFTAAVHLASSRQVRAAKDCRALVLKSAERLRKEAERRGVPDEAIVLNLHRLMVTTAALAPMIAAGAVRRGPVGDVPPSDLDKMADWFEKNGWSVPFFAVTYASILRLEFHAAPWDPRRWKGALKGWLFCSVFATPEGSTWTPRADKAAREAAEVASLHPCGA